MGFLNVLKKIEQDITIGINAAAPIVGSFMPGVGLILTSIGKGLNVLEEKKADADGVSPSVQAIATQCTIMQHSGACTWDANCTACCAPQKTKDKKQWAVAGTLSQP
jgi:hypothetical protein